MSGELLNNIASRNFQRQRASDPTIYICSVITNTQDLWKSPCYSCRRRYTGVCDCQHAMSDSYHGRVLAGVNSKLDTFRCPNCQFKHRGALNHSSGAVMTSGRI